MLFNAFNRSVVYLVSALKWLPKFTWISSDVCCKLMRLICILQPHGFFNCSPAVDVPPSACEFDSKDIDGKDGGVAKPLRDGMLAKL